MMRVFVTHPRPRLEQYFGARALQALRAIAEVRLNASETDLEAEGLVQAAEGCDVLIAYRQTPAPRRLFEGLPKLAAFLRCAVDIRSVDIEAASEHGVLVTQASAGYVAAVSEWVLGAMVNLGRNVCAYVHEYHAGLVPAPTMGRQLRGSTLGIIGYGQIGSNLGELALALGMDVLACTPQALRPRDGLRQVSLDELLGKSDFVVCLAPASAETEKLVDGAAFAAMKPGAFFINCSRAELVDEAALRAALDTGRLAGCALDVGNAPDQMPSPELARHPKVLATPHVGGLTLPAIEHQATETVLQLEALLQGKIPRGAVNAPHATRLSRWAAFAAPAPRA